MGALTAKPTAFNFRTWEVNSMMYVSCQDSLTPNIRVDLYQKKIVRVLPLENWINDSIRFLFTHLDKQTVKFPALNFLRKSKFLFSKFKITLRQHTYVAVMNYISRRISKKRVIKTNINLLLGSIFTKNQDLYYKLNFKDTNLNFLANSSFLNKKKSDLNIYNNILLLNMNTRLDSPLFDLDLKDLDSKILSIGNFQSNYDIVSNTLKSLLNLGDKGNGLLVYSESMKNDFFIKNISLDTLNLTPVYLNLPLHENENLPAKNIFGQTNINFSLCYNNILKKKPKFLINLSTHIQKLDFDIFIPTTNYFVSTSEIMSVNGVHKLKMIRPSFSLKDHIMALTLLTKNTEIFDSINSTKIFFFKSLKSISIIKNRLSFLYRQILPLQKLNKLYKN